MEALQIYRDEEIKMADHREECQAIGKEVSVNKRQWLWLLKLN